MKMNKKLAVRLGVALAACVPMGVVYAEICKTERECEVTTTTAHYSDSSVILSQDVSCGPWQRVCEPDPMQPGGGGGGGMCSMGCGGQPTTDPTPEPTPTPDPSLQRRRCYECKELCRSDNAKMLWSCEAQAMDLAMQRCTEGRLPNGGWTRPGTKEMVHCVHCKKWRITNNYGYPQMECESFEQQFCSPENHQPEPVYQPSDIGCVSAWVNGQNGAEQSNGFQWSANFGNNSPFGVSVGTQHSWTSTTSPRDGLNAWCLNHANQEQNACMTNLCSLECNF